METRDIDLRVVVEEDIESTVARAEVEIRGCVFGGWGRARRNPTDPNVPLVGEELAVARALSNLSHRLIDAAATEIERFEGRSVRLVE